MVKDCQCRCAIHNKTPHSPTERSLLQDSNIDLVELNMPQKITALQLSLTELAKRLSKHQHILQLHTYGLIAKPYALPVQCTPYVRLMDNKAQEVVNKVIQEMVNRGMHETGMF